MLSLTCARPLQELPFSWWWQRWHPVLTRSCPKSQREGLASPHASFSNQEEKYFQDPTTDFTSQEKVWSQPHLFLFLSLQPGWEKGMFSLLPAMPCKRRAASYSAVPCTGLGLLHTGPSPSLGGPRSWISPWGVAFGLASRHQEERGGAGREVQVPPPC